MTNEPNLLPKEGPMKTRIFFMTICLAITMITANDGMGHLCEATVEISAETSFENADAPQGQTGSGHPVQGSKILKIIAGLSVILNLAFAAEFFHRWSIAAKR